MKFSYKIIILSSLCLHSSYILATSYHEWKDNEGVKQFSNLPPPISCISDSCLKIHQKTKDDIEYKKRQAQQQLEYEQRIAKENKIKQKSLVKGVAYCNDNSSAEEYANVEEARRFLIQENKCQLVEESIKYSFIRRRQKLSKIRLYLLDGKSAITWVETKNIVIPKKK